MRGSRLCAIMIVVFATLPLGEARAERRPKARSQNRLFLQELVKRIGSLTSVDRCEDLFSPYSSYEIFLTDPTLQAQLRRRKHWTRLTKENSLAFKNEAEDFACVAEKSYGFCGGMTKLTKRFAFLGFFDPENLSRALVPDPVADPEGWRRFYVARLEKIASGKAESIPGFRNLYELSSDPVLSVEMKRLAAEKWAEDALSTSGLSVYMKVRAKMLPWGLAARISTLLARVEHNELPRILFSAFSPRPVGGVRIHSVSVWKVDRLKNGSIRLWTWETNSGVTTKEINQNFIFVRPDGSMYYHPWYVDHLTKQGKDIHPRAGEVAQISVIPEDFTETARIANEIYLFCRGNPLCGK